MTFLPIVVRELRVAARRKSTYRVRFWTAFGAIIFGSYLVFVSGAFLGRRSGAVVFSSLVSIGFLGCLFLVANTVDCISEEKREGTLGFLFLTDLKGYDIALGKLFSSSLLTFYLILGVFPVVALSMLLGGVSAREFWEVALALLNVFFFSQAVGILVSTLSRNRRSANSAATVLLLAYAGGLPLLESVSRAERWGGWVSMLGWLNPGFCVYRALAPGSSGYWTSLLLVHLNAWLFLAAASWWLPRSWQEKAAKARISWGERLRQWYHARYTPRNKLLDTNPFLWLAIRNRLGSLRTWGVLLILGVFWGCLLCKINVAEDGMPVFFAAIIINHLMVKLLMASEASGNLEEQRHSGALELLLSCTPLQVDEVVGGQWLALRRQFLGPTIAVIASDFLMLVFVVDHAMPNKSSDDKSNFVLFVLALVVMLVVDMFALGWVGMWKAMSQKKPRHAAGATVSQILLLPWAVLFLFGALGIAAVGLIHSFGGAVVLWFLVGVVVDFASIFLSRDQLLSQLRARAAVHGEESLGLFGQLGRALGKMASR
jgi:hypothetical protein